MTKETPDEKIKEGEEGSRKHGGRNRNKKQLFRQIEKLMEFYLSDANLRKDRYFNQLLKENPEIDIEIFLKCNKLASLTNDPEDIIKALQKSKLLEITEDGTKVRRIKPVQDKQDIDACTIYVEKLPPEAEHDWIERVFSEYGKVTYVSLPKFKSTGQIKGFAFVEFSCQEEAAKALKAYTEMGCCLPSTTAPETLVSITTFEGEESNLGSQIGDKKRVHTTETTAEASKGEVGDEPPPSKKAKLESNDSKSEPTVVEKTKVAKEDVGNESPPSKKAKLESTDSKSGPTVVEKTKVAKEVGDEPPPSKKAKLESNDAKSEPTTVEKQSKTEIEESETTAGEASETEKKETRKKSRKKKKKGKEDLDKNFGLQVLSKIEWKKLRNKYLNLQRTKMNKLKTHLHSIKRNQWQPPQYYEEHTNKKKKEAAVDNTTLEDKKDNEPKTAIEFVRGVILKVNLEEPLVDEKLFKNELRHKPNIKYIDAHVGSQEAFIRCVNPEEAEKLAESKTFPACYVLKDEEEVLYWEKIELDRKVKFSTKPKVKRGRSKLLRKAEKALGKHIRFDHEEENHQDN